MKPSVDQKFIIQPTDRLPGQTRLTGQDARHIFKVLRLKINDILWLTDGCGFDYKGRIIQVSPGSVDLEIFEQIESTTESYLKLVLFSGMLKDKKMDMIIKHVTQLGIHQWFPFFCERSVPSPGRSRLQKRYDRWQTIARESLKQCRRSRMVDIKFPMAFDQAMEAADPFDLKIAFWEKSKKPFSTLSTSKQTQTACILIGPEGGFSETEIQQAIDKGFSAYSLGPRILRAETASIAACTLIQHLVGDV